MMLRRALAGLGGWAGLMFLRVQSAAAAPVAAEDTLGQTPPALSWIDLKDSRGISIWNFEMSVDRGGPMSPDKFFWSALTDTCWGIYRSMCALALWFLDWVLSFTWVPTIASPLLAVGDAMQQVVTRLGLVPTFLTLTALMAGLWFLKGRHLTAVWEVGIACVIAALASGVFAHPVQLIAGPDGYIVKAAQAGQDIAAALASGESAGKSPDELRRAQTGQLVDTFVRQPTQMINFGRVLDGGTCEGAYNDVVKAGPYGTESDIRDKVGECNEDLGNYAANPSASMALGATVFFPASFVILALCVVLGGSVVAAAVWAMFQSLKAIVALVTGLLPGGGRGSLMLVVAETVVALLIIVFTSVFLSVFLLVIQALFAASEGASIPKTFVIVDVLLVVGLVIYLRQRKQLSTASARLAQWMSQRPGGAPPTKLPERSPGVGLGAASTAVRTAASVAQWRAQRAAADRPTPPAFSDNRQQMAVFFPFPRGGQDNGPLPHYPATPAQRPGAPGQPQLPGSPARPQLPPGGPQGSQPPSDGAGLRRVQSRKKVGGALLRAGTHAALAYATGGTSSAVTGAAKAASAGKSARRAALATRIAIGAGRSATQPSRPAPGPRAPRLDQGRPGSAADAVIRGEVIPPRPPAAGNPGKGLQPPAGKRSAPAGKPPQPCPAPPAVTSTPPVSRTPTQPSETQRSENTQRADQLRQRVLDRTRPRRSA